MKISNLFLPLTMLLASTTAAAEEKLTAQEICHTLKDDGVVCANNEAFCLEPADIDFTLRFAKENNNNSRAMINKFVELCHEELSLMADHECLEDATCAAADAQTQSQIKQVSTYGSLEFINTLFFRTIELAPFNTVPKMIEKLNEELNERVEKLNEELKESVKHLETLDAVVRRIRNSAT